jgi:hypothetical protein
MARARLLAMALLVSLASAAPANGTPCAPRGGLPGALLACRTWIAFSPPRPYDPQRKVFPTKRELRNVLAQLHREGWRGLVTFSMDGTLRHVPRLAAPGRVVVLKEVWWPSAGDPAASPASQAEFFRRLRHTDVPFVFGSAYDAFWNTAESAVGTHWGLHTDSGEPKEVLRAFERERLLEPAGAER